MARHYSAPVLSGVFAAQLALLGLAVAPPLEAQTRVTFEPPTSVAGFASAAVLVGDELFVGRTGVAPGFPLPPSRPGSVHVYQRSGDGFEEVAVVEAEDGVVGDGFGSAVAAQGDWLAVGASGAGAGTVHLFRRTSSGWVPDGRLSKEDGSFGQALALHDGGLFVGSGDTGSNGTVFTYHRTDSGWQPGPELTASDAEDQRFGASLSARGNQLLVGAPGPGGSVSAAGIQGQPGPGAAYLFQQDGDSWNEVARLAVVSENAAEASLGLGSKVHLGDGWLVAGAPISGGAKGAVYEFRRGGDGAWSLSQRVAASPGEAPALLGADFAVAGSDLLVGAPFVGQGVGAVYVFRRAEDGAWTEAQSLTVEAEGLATLFGMSVTAEGNTALLGAPAADFFEGTGYVFARADDGTWSQTNTVTDVGTGLESITGDQVDCAGGNAAGFACEDVDLVSFLPVSALGGKRGIMVSDVWGWTDPETGREYAIVGRFDGTSFVDVTDAGNPIFLGDLPMTEGATMNLWRDIKVYANHAFVVADAAGAHGVQIFDLTRLRDFDGTPETFTEDAHYDGIHSAHNIVINEETGFAYSVGSSMGGETCGGGLHMIDVRDPKNPTFAGCFADSMTGNAGTGYSHDAMCMNYRGPDAEHAGKEICFGANETALSIADVTDKANPVALSRASYPNVAYSHQGWISEDHKFFFLNDELDELSGTQPKTRTLVWDVQDLDDPVLLTEYQGETAASDHNLYVKGDLMYQSNYVSGLRIIDISDAANPVEVAHFDTVPWGDDAPGFAGSWSNYPFFESGNIIVSSMREGLFVLKKRSRPIS